MRFKLLVSIMILCLMAFIPQVFSDGECITLQDGTLQYSAGHYSEGLPLVLDFDAWGYNYQAHMFNGSYANAYLGRDGFPPYTGDDASYLAENPSVETHWTWPYRDDELAMKWNEAWLSNQDCDGDGKLDRHYGFGTYRGSGAWLTNHQQGGKGRSHWTYFVKIVAAPTDATVSGGNYFGADGGEIGPAIWGQFAILQEVESGEGVTYLSPSGSGFGQYAP